MRLSREVGLRAQALVRTRLGLAFTEGREADLEQGLRQACRASSAGSLSRYLDRLASSPDESPEWLRLAGYLTVGETYFFRDQPCFEALERQILPQLIAARRASELRHLRIWSAGCATGEEPVSVAILLNRLLPDPEAWTLTILGTDINPSALDAARQGRYRSWSLRATPPDVQARYFRNARGSERFELSPEILRMVTFAPLNLASDTYPALVTNTAAMDVILCRNVLMYFTAEAQREAVARLARALAPGGWLILSPAETSADLTDALLPVTLRGAIFFRKPTQPAEQAPPPMPREPGVPEHTHQAVHATGSALPSPPALPGRRAEQLLDSEPLVQRSRALADQGRLDEAYRVCEAALQRDQLDVDAHLLMAGICQERGAIDSALGATRRAIFLDPRSAPAHFLLGSLYLRRGEHERARKCMRTVVTLVSDDPPDRVLPGGETLSAGRLLAAARAYLIPHRPPSAAARTRSRGARRSGPLQDDACAPSARTNRRKAGGSP